VLTTEEHLRKAWNIVQETADALWTKSQILTSKSQTGEARVV
jgi:hypothetical protein